MGGEDATEAFEDVGHSDEAREQLAQLLVGNLKRMVRTAGRSHLIYGLPDFRPLPIQLQLFTQLLHTA